MPELSTAASRRVSHVHPFGEAAVLIRDNLYCYSDGTLAGGFWFEPVLPDSAERKSREKAFLAALPALLDGHPAGLSIRVMRLARYVTPSDETLQAQRPADKFAALQRRYVHGLPALRDAICVLVHYRPMVELRQAGVPADTPVVPLSAGAIAPALQIQWEEMALELVRNRVKALYEVWAAAGARGGLLTSDDLRDLAADALGLLPVRANRTASVPVHNWEVGRGWVRTALGYWGVLAVRGIPEANARELAALTTVLAAFPSPMLVTTDVLASGTMGVGDVRMAVAIPAATLAALQSACEQLCASVEALGAEGTAGLRLSRTVDGTACGEQLMSMFACAPRTDVHRVRRSLAVVAAALPVMGVGEDGDFPDALHLTESGRLVGYEPWPTRAANQHTVVMGQSGVGKGLFVKTAAILPHLAAGLSRQAIILDPAGEYVRLGQTLGATILTLDADSFASSGTMAFDMVQAMGDQDVSCLVVTSAPSLRRTEGEGEAFAQILRALSDGLLSRDGRPRLVVLDETWVFGPAIADSLTRLVREGRKYGVGIMAVVQAQGDLPQSVRENINIETTIEIIRPTGASRVRMLAYTLTREGRTTTRVAPLAPALYWLGTSDSVDSSVLDQRREAQGRELNIDDYVALGEAFPHGRSGA